MTRSRLVCYALTIATLSASGVVSTSQAAELRNLPEKVQFSFESTPGEKTVLGTLSGRKLECEKLTGSGEFTSERLGIAEYKFVACEDPGSKVKCTGLSDTTGNITVKAEFHTRALLSGASVNVATLLSAIHFSCSVVLLMDTGCQATMDLLTKSGGTSIVNLLLESVFISFLQQSGDQIPSEIDTDNSLGMEGCVLLTKEGTATAETSSMLGTGTIGHFMVNGKAVTELVDLQGTF